MNKIVAIVGMCGSGKSVATKFFQDAGYESFYFGGVTMKKLKEADMEINPENEKLIREKLRAEYGMGAFAAVLKEDIKKALKNNNIVLDGLYSWSEYKILIEEIPNLQVIAIVNDKSIRYDRLTAREERPLSNTEAHKRDISEIENIEKGGPIAFADFFIINNNSKEEYYNELERVKNIIEMEK